MHLCGFIYKLRGKYFAVIPGKLEPTNLINWVQFQIKIGANFSEDRKIKKKTGWKLDS